MAHSFQTGYGKHTFGVFKEPQTAGDYITKKKAHVMFCNVNPCAPGAKVNTQGDLTLLRNNVISTDIINTTNLDVNLITKMDLADVTVCDPSYNSTDVSGNNDIYYNYTIDPSGQLFGDTICGVNNYVKYLVYNPPTNE